MDSAFLLNFVQVIEQGSIADVARKNGLTPAAVNQRIKKLEEELGFKLVVRAGRTVKATVEGDQLLEQAKRVLEEIRNLKTVAQQPAVFGHIALGAFDSAMTTTIPAILPPLIERYPSLEVSLVKGYSVNLYSKVCNGEVDAALIVQPQFQIPKYFEWHRVHDEPLVVLAPFGNTEQEPNQILRSHPLICYDRSLWGGQLAVNYFRQHNIRPKIRIEVASIDVIALLVSKGLGVSLVPDCIAAQMLESSVRKIPLAGNDCRGVGLFWNRQSVRAKLIDEILELSLAWARAIKPR
jgi:DNA-binding transcriptional LysR family regulator